MNSFKQFIAKRATSENPIITEAYPLATNDSYLKIDINQQPDNESLDKAAKELKKNPDKKKKGSVKPQLGASLIDHLKIALDSGVIEMYEYEGDVKTALNKLIKAIKPDVWSELAKELTDEQKEAIYSVLTSNKDKKKKMNKEQYQKGNNGYDEPYQNLYVHKEQYREAR